MIRLLVCLANMSNRIAGGKPHAHVSYVPSAFTVGNVGVASHLAVMGT